MNHFFDKKIVLIGPMGAGKSTVAYQLADMGQLVCFDTDAMVEAASGHSISELFTTVGEAGFRELESQALAEALQHDQPCVVATGGGVVLAADNRRLLRAENFVVWLDADAATLVQHIGDTTSRPLFQGRDATEVLSQILSERHDLYAEVADFHVDVTSYGGPRAVAEYVLELLGDDE